MLRHAPPPTCLLSSGRLSTPISPLLARYTRQFSRYSASREEVKVADLQDTVGRDIDTGSLT